MFFRASVMYTKYLNWQLRLEARVRIQKQHFNVEQNSLWAVMNFLKFKTPTQFTICTCLFMLASGDQNKVENRRS